MNTPILSEDAFIFDKFLLLDSRDRSIIKTGTIETLTPINNFIFKFPIDSNGESFWAIQSCNLENKFQTINAYNNIIKINGTNFTILIGTYDIAGLIAAVNAAITPTNVVFSISGITGLVSVAGTAPFTIESGVDDADENILISQLGYISYPVIGGTTPNVAVNKPSIYYTRFIDIQSRRLTAYQISDESSSKLTRNNILRIFVNSPLDVINFENRLLNKYKFEPTSSIGFTDITLVDEWGSPALLLGDFLINVILFKRINVHHNFII